MQGPCACACACVRERVDLEVREIDDKSFPISPSPIRVRVALQQSSLTTKLGAQPVMRGRLVG